MSDQSQLYATLTDLRICCYAFQVKISMTFIVNSFNNTTDPSADEINILLFDKLPTTLCGWSHIVACFTEVCTFFWKLYLSPPPAFSNGVEF